jgi:hypothetical protein
MTEGDGKLKLINRFLEMDRLFKAGGFIPIHDAVDLIVYEFGSAREAQDLGPNACIDLARQICKEAE